MAQCQTKQSRPFWSKFKLLSIFSFFPISLKTQAGQIGRVMLPFFTKGLLSFITSAIHLATLRFT
jgi:hypothetical protein